MNYQNTSFRVVSIITHLASIVLTLVYFCYWCLRLRSRGLQFCLPEQKWITVLFIALILYQDPFYTSVLLVQLRVYRILSGISFFISFAYFLIFWLFMLDGARATRKQIKSMKFNDQTHFISTPPAITDNNTSPRRVQRTQFPSNAFTASDRPIASANAASASAAVDASHAF